MEELVGETVSLAAAIASDHEKDADSIGQDAMQVSFMSAPEQVNTYQSTSAELGEPVVLPDTVIGSDEENGNLACRRAMNSTAYRIFKLLQWLMEAPMSVDEMNARFCMEPQIGKPVSSDSIWLYINTLKELGCRIRRPSLRNGFKYEMLSHPFGLVLDDAQLDTLAQAKAHAQRNFTPQDMLVLDRMFKKIVAYSTCEDPKQVIEHLFARSRSFDYEDCQGQIEALEGWIRQGQLLWLGYQSPRHGQEHFHFLPTGLFYEQGVVYLRGERPEFDTPSSLRLDRILDSQPVSEPTIVSELVERSASRVEVILHVLAETSGDFAGLQLGEHQGVFEESTIWVESGGYYELRLQVRDLFYVKQRLLSCGQSFRVLAPADFKRDLMDTLEAMLRFYQAEGGLGGGNASICG